MLKSVIFDCIPALKARERFCTSETITAIFNLAKMFYKLLYHIFATSKSLFAKKQRKVFAFLCHITKLQLRLYFYDFLALVVTAMGAYSVRHLKLAALCAFRKCGKLELPYVRTSFIASCL